MAKEGNTSSMASNLPLPIRPVNEMMSGVSKDGVKGKSGNGVMGMFRKLRRGGGEELSSPIAFSSGNAQAGPAFGVPLNEAPPPSWCTSFIGGQRHELPLIVFTVVEEIYRRGMSQSGIFRLAGDGTRISHLTKVFNLPPLYGYSLSISSEPMHNLTGLVKRYVRDLPEPIPEESLFPAFLSFCAEPEPGALVLPLSTRIAAAQILLKLLPPLHFSLFIYLLAFLGQLPLFPDNRLNVESISIIFGPAMCAARGKGISGLGPGLSGSRGVEPDAEEVSNLVNQSQSTLAWLLRNWSAISEEVLDPPFEDGEGDKELEKDRKAQHLDPRLLSPIDLRTTASPDPSPFTRPRSSTLSQPPVKSSRPPLVKPADLIRLGSSSSQSTAVSGSASSTSLVNVTRKPTSAPISPSTSGSGIFARAFSRRSISSQAKGEDEVGLIKAPKRSASFTSLSSFVKKGGALTGMADTKSVPMPEGGRSSSDDRAARNSQEAKSASRLGISSCEM